jgi:hypothetical protein
MYTLYDMTKGYHQDGRRTAALPAKAEKGEKNTAIFPKKIVCRPKGYHRDTCMGGTVG